MSTHRVEVIPVHLEKHPNADTLSLVRIADYTCVVRTADWAEGDLAAYIEPDYVVPLDRPEFGWLKEQKTILHDGILGHRVKCRKLRGVMSMGLLVPAPAGLVPGDNALDVLGVRRYDPPLQTLVTGGEAIRGPAADGIYPKYDVESGRKYAGLMIPGEEVVVTEKVHGASARYVCVDGIMYCGSRGEWKRDDPANLWWMTMRKTPGLEEWCRANPGVCVYGEVYGQVQDLKYGRSDTAFLAFDLRSAGAWWNHDAGREAAAALPWVPVLYRGPWDKEAVFALSDGPSVVSLTPQIREGIVIKPVTERWEHRLGRVQIKVVSSAYLERA